MKALKEENFSLKLRIYMLEEEKSEREDDDGEKNIYQFDEDNKENNQTNNNREATTTTQRRKVRVKSSPTGRDAANSDLDSTLSSSSVPVDLGHETNEDASRHRRRRRRKHRSNDHLYASDCEQKEIELENLNRIVMEKLIK